MRKIDKHFVSKIDQQLAKFDATHAMSSAQKSEYEKYQRIYQLRDVPTECAEKEDIWK